MPLVKAPLQVSTELRTPDPRWQCCDEVVRVTLGSLPRTLLGSHWKHRKIAPFSSATAKQVPCSGDEVFLGTNPQRGPHSKGPNRSLRRIGGIALASGQTMLRRMFPHCEAWRVSLQEVRRQLYFSHVTYQKKIIIELVRNAIHRRMVEW